MTRIQQRNTTKNSQGNKCSNRAYLFNYDKLWDTTSKLKHVLDKHTHILREGGRGREGDREEERENKFNLRRL